MSALTSDRNTSSRSGIDVVHPLAANVRIFGGALVCLDASGNAVPGQTATGLKSAGRALEQVNNIGGSAGDVSIRVDRGVFQFANHDTDVVDRTHIGSTAYIVDDQTVASTDGTGTRSAAGKIIDVENAGVWVEIK